MRKVIINVTKMQRWDFNRRIQELLDALARLPISRVTEAKFGLAWIGSLFHLGDNVTAKTLEEEYKQLWDKTQSSS